MSRLYVANVTKQKQIVYYRLDINRKGETNVRQNFQPAKQQDIEPGRQVILGADFHPDQIRDIVDQLAPYGLIGEVDVPRMGDKFYPYIFNIDRPVSADAMRQVRDHNLGIKTGEGVQRRQKSAVAANDMVQDTVARQFAHMGIEAEPNDATDVVIEQQEQSEAGERMIADGFHVRPGGKETAERAQGKPGRTKARRNARKRK